MEMTQKASEFDPLPVVPQPVLKGPLAALLEWQAMAEGAYSANTLRAKKADGAIFQAFCESRGEPYLPAAPKTIRAFIEDRVKAGRKPATIRRYVATVARVHIAAGTENQGYPVGGPRTSPPEGGPGCSGSMGGGDFGCMTAHSRDFGL